ncbi:MAG: photosystem II protein Y [Phormidesmis sp.]
MFNLSSIVDLRVLCVLSPITTALVWAMFIHEEPSLRDDEPWWY